MAKATLPFAEWRPDIALLDNQFANVADNVFATPNSYKPIPSLLPYTTSTLPAPCVGLTSARTTAGDWKVYAGTATKLYTFSLAGWTDVSRLVGGNYHVPPGELWSWAQFGDNLVAVNIGDVPQMIPVTSGTNFAALAGSPPQAHNVKQIGDFLFLSGLASNLNAVQWSAINDITGWIPGTNLSDVQILPDSGPVKGIAGSEIGFIVQDRGIRTLQFLSGDIVYVFNIQRVVKDKGCTSEYAFTTVADVLYFLAEDGFYALAGSSQLIPIGQDKVNEWFLANSDISRRNVVQIVASNKPYVAWAFHSSSAAPTYDRIIIYNWAIQRWTTGSISAQAWEQIASIGLDLDTTGSEPGDQYLDSPPAPLPPNQPQSLDSFAYVGGRPAVGAVNPAGQLCTLTGPSLAPTLETAEAHLVPGQRAFVSNAYPLVDGDQATVTVSTRERLQDTPVWNTPTPLEITGSASILTSSRLHRFRVNVAAGDVWTHAQGVIAEVQPDGAA